MNLITTIRPFKREFKKIAQPDQYETVKRELIIGALAILEFRKEIYKKYDARDAAVGHHEARYKAFLDRFLDSFVMVEQHVENPALQNYMAKDQPESVLLFTLKEKITEHGLNHITIHINLE